MVELARIASRFNLTNIQNGAGCNSPWVGGHGGGCILLPLQYTKILSYNYVEYR